MRLALGSVTDAALDEYLRTHPHTKRIVICTENDDSGNDAAEQMHAKYSELGFTVERELPQGKDFNEMLCANKSTYCLSMYFDESRTVRKT